MNLRYSLFLIIPVLFIYSCSSTDSVVENTSSGLYPSWYSSNGFQSDSTIFSGFGSAIASDSSLAIQRASDESKKNLDLAIGNMAEDVRAQLVSDGVSSAGNTDFILILRNAHADAVNQSDMIEYSTLKEGDIYRSFVQVGITKTELLNQLETGFNGHPRYWATFSDNSAFKTLFQ